MTARCQLCGITVTGRYVAQDATELEMLMMYDNLAAHMWIHIVENHRAQAEEGMAAKERAARMYAMNWADHTETMVLIKQEWRKAMLMAMTVTTQIIQNSAAGHQAAAEDTAAGSNEKNSARKRSN